MNPHVEIVTSGSGQVLAYMIKAGWRPQATEFVTPDTFSLQMGMIVYGANHEIVRHMHLPISREVQGTNEVVIIREGACDIDLYDDERVYVGSRRMEKGDIVLLLGGGHGFRMHEDTVLFEVKQGPYAGGRDKERF
jgi:hypothetical protein